MIYLGKKGVVYATPEIGREVPYAGATLRNDEYPNRDGQSHAARYMGASFCQNGLLAASNWGCTFACRSCCVVSRCSPCRPTIRLVSEGKALVVHARSKFMPCTP